MALSILTHHMTGLGLGLGMVGWFIFHAVVRLYSLRRLVVNSGMFISIAVLIVLPWAIPFLIHALDVGFRREIPGLWQPDISIYTRYIIDSSRIGDFIYPTYLGITFMALAIAGTVYALVEKQRLGGLAVLLIVLLWFSMGADNNPLIRVYPFSGLDIAPFHLFMVPFMAILGGHW